MTLAMPSFRARLIRAVALATFVPAVAAAAPEKLNFVDRSQATITRPGQYALRRTIETASDAPVVTIAADDVTLDLDGYGLVGPGGKASVGILIEGRRNVRVRNGNLAGFGTAVRIVDAVGVAVTDLTITGHDQPATPPETGILALDSRGLRIEHNTIARTFLGIFVRGGGSGANMIKGNTVAGGDNGQLGVCYNPAPGADAATDGPQGDLVAENLVSRFNVGLQTSLASRANMFVRNYVAFFETAIDERTPGSNVFANNVTTQLTR